MVDEKPCSESKPIFRPLSADDPEPEATIIDSLCINCQENGTTQILLTKIPFFKEVVLMSFECEHCGYKNNEIQSGGKVEEKGVKIVLNVRSSTDLNRQVCKSDYTCIKIPELDFEIPSMSQKGEITTVEGILERAIEGLEQCQPARKEVDPENAQKIDEFILNLKNLLMDHSFTLIIEDISGNSFVSNPNAPAKDPGVTTTHFTRTLDQDHILGIYRREEVLDEIPEEQDEAAGVLKPVNPDEYTYDNIIQEVMQFQTNCANCSAPCQTNMKMTNIPYFKEVVIMATTCEACGHRSNEVKSGGGIEPQGLRIELKISSPEDLTRDILKSETCSLNIPELDLEVGAAALSGRFTTVEGLLINMKEQLYDSHTMFQDSQDSETKKRLDEFIQRFDNILKLERPFTLILDDPAGNSYVQTLQEPDSGLIIDKYERSFEQNEELGLNDIKTEDYETGGNTPSDTETLVVGQVSPHRHIQ